MIEKHWSTKSMAIDTLLCCIIILNMNLIVYRYNITSNLNQLASDCFNPVSMLVSSVDIYDT
jgi:hypothetical protein